jgi:hypothetical protein
MNSAGERGRGGRVGRLLVMEWSGVRVRALLRPSFGCSRPLRTSFSYLTLVVHTRTRTHDLGFHSLLALLSIGLVVITFGLILSPLP